MQINQAGSLHFTNFLLRCLFFLLLFIFLLFFVLFSLSQGVSSLFRVFERREEFCCDFWSLKDKKVIKRKLLSDLCDWAI